jgi:hypothetical protein
VPNIDIDIDFTPLNEIRFHLIPYTPFLSSKRKRSFSEVSKTPAVLLDGKPIALCSKFVLDVSAVNPLIAFTTFLESRER